MSVHNGEKYLRKAVESILSQTFRDFEFIIIDDGSEDRSRAILEEIAAKDGRIRLVSRENRGLTKSLNEGLGLASGEYIARMDADDVSLPERLACQVEFLRLNLSHAAVGAAVMMTDSELRPVRIRPQPRRHAGICRELLTGDGGAMTHPAVMLRRSAVLKVGCYDERFVTTQDLDLFIRLSEVGELENLEAVLLLWRQHPESVNRTRASTWQSMKRLAIREAINRRGATGFAEALFPEPEHFPMEEAGIDFAEDALTNGQWTTAWHYAFKGLRDGPDRLRSMRTIFRIARRKSLGIAGRLYRQIRTGWGFDGDCRRGSGFHLRGTVD
jgi:glycosyltransferase involved in cell wall biosynthesis